MSSSDINLPDTQAAIVIREFGDPNVLTYQDDVPLPNRGNNQVLVKIAYAGINPVEYKTRQGKGWGADKIRENQFANDKSAILGFDMAGEVVACNPDDSKHAFKVGDKVAALSFSGGCYAQYNAVDADLLALVPDGVDLKSVGALPCVGITAKQLVDFADIKAGEHVVISAPAGGVGHLAVQLLMHKVMNNDLKLTLICSTDKYDKLKSLIDVDKLEGWINYTQYDDAFPSLEADLLLDLVGGDAGVKALSVVKSGGRVVVVPSIWVDKVKEASKNLDKEVTVEGFRVDPNADDISELMTLMADNKLTLQVQSTYPLKQAADAHRELEENDTFGKIVLEV